MDRPEKEDARVATAEPGGAEGAEGLEPAAVIIDPDSGCERTPEEKAIAEGTLLPKMPAAGGTGAVSGGRRIEVVSPAVAQAQQRKVEAATANERFEIPFETLTDPKFLVVWLSLLMAYPILRGDRGRSADARRANDATDYGTREGLLRQARDFAGRDPARRAPAWATRPDAELAPGRCEARWLP